MSALLEPLEYAFFRNGLAVSVLAGALCGLVGRLMKERDEATLRLVEPHLCALADAKAPRGDDHALMLYLTVGTYHTLVGDTQRARVYLERASALDAALGGSQPKPPRTPRGRR